MVNKKEKAIEQAIATLNIDKIYLRPEFIKEYRQKNNLHIEPTPKVLVLKKGDQNANNR